jgi:tRNA(fMet)-specific endonuclease VapC
MYLLDTNVCIAILNGSPASVAARFESAVLAGTEVCVSSISVFELAYGVENSARRAFNAKRVDTFLGGPMQVLPLTEGDAARAGELRAALAKEGRPIGPYDTLIAGQALARCLILVTHNLTEFRRVPGLKLEDWQT